MASLRRFIMIRRDESETKDKNIVSRRKSSSFGFFVLLFMLLSSDPKGTMPHIHAAELVIF